MDDYATQLEGVQNELKRYEILHERDVALCDSLENGTASAWTGSVTDIGADALKYQGHITISIAPNVTIGTWNNAFSDIGDDTLIDRDTTVFAMLPDIDVGDRVLFSADLRQGSDGACVTGKNTLGNSYGSEPDFLASVTDLY